MIKFAEMKRTIKLDKWGFLNYRNTIPEKIITCSRLHRMSWRGYRILLGNRAFLGDYERNLK
ncbi:MULTISPECIES: hypothetical protein [unclassified Dorea]|uniref:hypothetical protein n=1 Tax=unclassified Dorea TaxID=2627917 RepID=UPI00136DFDB8|nr:hypothetical protein [Dorea sp. BIOML-A1]MZK44603.1 hypothetical protein [Dorea sp. BIOML-A1]